MLCGRARDTATSYSLTVNATHVKMVTSLLHYHYVISR